MTTFLSRSYFTYYFFISLSSVLCVIPSRGQVKTDSVWIQTAQGCKVYNPNPKKGETIGWTGKCLNGFASDSGTLIWYAKGKPMQKLVGSMKKGVNHGKGIYTFEGDPQHILDGFFVNGELEGLAKITHRDKKGKVVYSAEGMFKAGFQNGFGTEVYFESESGDTVTHYTGNFFDSQWHGDGYLVEFEKDGREEIKGQFNNGQLEGSAEIWHYREKKLRWYYKGAYKDGSINGFGEEIRGAIHYIGEWTNNLQHGSGKMMMDSLLVYDGEWKYGDFDGVGKRFYFEGSNFVGELKKNKRNGFGIVNGPGEFSYVGEFQNDLYNGLGYVLKGKEIVFSGRWVDGNTSDKLALSDVKKRLLERYQPLVTRLGLSIH